MRLIVGLGNPGLKYARTRHNVGFLLLDHLIGAEGESWKSWKGGKADWRLWDPMAEGGSRGEGEALGKMTVLLLKPQEYMNLSGAAVRDFAGFYKILPSEILVCYDDFALPFGSVRMRLKGSSGGHNGMQSILDALGSQEIPRIRIGIGPAPEGRDPKDYVLQRFSPNEIRRLEEAVFPKLELCLKDVLDSGFEHAMNICNTPVQSGESD